MEPTNAVEEVVRPWKAEGSLLRSAFKGGIGTPLTVAMLIGGAYLAIHDDLITQRLEMTALRDQMTVMNATIQRLDLWIRPAPVLYGMAADATRTPRRRNT